MNTPSGSRYGVLARTDQLLASIKMDAVYGCACLVSGRIFRSFSHGGPVLPVVIAGKRGAFVNLVIANLLLCKQCLRNLAYYLGNAFFRSVNNKQAKMAGVRRRQEDGSAF